MNQIIVRKSIFIKGALLLLLAVLALCAFSPKAMAVESVEVAIKEGDSLEQIKSKIQTTIDNEQNTSVTVTGSKTGVDNAIFLSIPEGKTVVWKATYASLDSYSLNLILLTGSGTFEVTDGGEITTVKGYAVSVSSIGNNEVVVSGGKVSSDQKRAISIGNNGCNVTVSGGTVSSKTGSAIYVSSTSTPVTVSGGLVFAYGTGLSDVVSSAGTTAASTSVTDTGMIIAWNSSGSGTYTASYTSDIYRNPSGTSATAYWATQGGESGIFYKNGTNVGFIPISGVTITKRTLTIYNLKLGKPVSGLNKTYDTTAVSGVGSVTHGGSDSVTSETGGQITVYYTGADGTSYDKSTTPPTNAGKYAVTAEVAGGTDYTELTESSAISLGSFTIAKKELSISSMTVTSKTYDGTTDATISVVFSGDLDSLAKGTDYTAVGTFDDANAGSRTVTGVVTLSNTAKAANYTITDNTESTSATIAKATTSGTGYEFLVASNYASSDYSISLAELLPVLNLPKRLGEVSYSVKSVTNTDGVLATVPADGAAITSPFKPEIASVDGADKTAVITITVASENYEDFDVDLTIKTVNAVPVTISGISMPGGEYSGSAYTPSGTAVITVSDTGVPVNDITPEFSYEGIDETDYPLSSTAPSDVGKYRLIAYISASSGYIGRVELEYEITKKTETGGSVTPPSDNSTITAPTTEAGWTDAAKTVNDAKDGAAVTVNMKDSSEVPADFFEEIAGKDVTVVFDMGDGLTWSVDGTDIPSGTDLSSIDLAAITGEGFVPAEVCNIDGSISEVQLHLSHNGDFGFSMTLTVALDKNNAGNFANLFYFNPETQSLEFQSSAKIEADGSVSLSFGHASDYLIAVSVESLASDFWKNPFIDVNDSDWFYDDVRYVAETGLFTGTGADTFSPETPMTRGMLVTVLGKLEGIDISEFKDQPFKDTAADEYYGPYVSWAAKNNLVSGYNADSFGPEDGITREQLATLLWNYAKYKNIDVSVGEGTNILSYNDALEVSEYAFAALQWACGEGIVSGRPGGFLDPKAGATRAETAALLHRFLTEVVA